MGTSNYNRLKNRPKPESGSGCSSEVEHLHGMHKVLGSITSTTKLNKTPLQQTFICHFHLSYPAKPTPTNAS
jgi:hypothetical protein